MAIDMASNTSGNLVNQTKEVGKGLVPESESIRANMENVNAYKASNEAAPAPAPKSAPSPKDMVNPKARYGSRPGEKRIDVSDMTKKLPSYKTGTASVPETGPAMLHKGEAVIPADKADAFKGVLDTLGGVDKPKKPKKEVEEIRTRKGKSGGYIHKHIHTAPEHHKDEEHVSPDQDHMLEHMMEHMGEKNEGEDEADKGEHGIPEEATESGNEAQAEAVGAQ